MFTKKSGHSQREFHGFLSIPEFRSMIDSTEILTQSNLTKREIEIIEAISRGLSSDEISARFFISVYTVTTHRRNAMRKMNARSSAHLVRICFEEGMISFRSFEPELQF